MADPGPGRAGSADAAQDWSGLLAAVMAGGVPGGLVFDGSVESLGSLQQFVRRSVADPYWLLDPDHEDDMIALVGYLGQTLLAIAGGTWGWESDSDVLALVWPQVSAQGPRGALAELRWVALGDAEGVPVVHADPALGLAVLSPLHLLVQFLVLDGDENQDVAPLQLGRFWADVVGDYQKTHPGWKPTRSGAAPDPAGAAQQHTGHAEGALPDWLASQEQQWPPEWAAADPHIWDFSAQSLDALQQLVQRQLPQFTDFTAPDNTGFTESVTWYLGEVFRRTVPGTHWYFLDRRGPESQDPACATFYLRDRADSASPFYLFAGMYEGYGTPAMVHERWMNRAARHSGSDDRKKLS